MPTCPLYAVEDMVGGSGGRVVRACDSDSFFTSGFGLHEFESTIYIGVSERRFGTLIKNIYDRCNQHGVSVPPTVTTPTPRRGESPLRNG